MSAYICWQSILIVLVSRHDKQLASLQQKQSDILKEISDIKLSYLVSNIRGYCRRVCNLPIYNDFVWSTNSYYCFAHFHTVLQHSPKMSDLIQLCFLSCLLFFNICLCKVCCFLLNCTDVIYCTGTHQSAYSLTLLHAYVAGWMHYVWIDSLRMLLWLLAPHWSTSHKWGVPLSQHGV